MKQPLQFPIAWKVILIISVTSTILITVFSWILISRHQQALLLSNYENANLIGETFRQLTHTDMLLDRRDSVYAMMDTIGQRHGIFRIRIMNKEGKITYSSTKAEAGQTVNKESEACYSCHKRDVPLTRLNTEERSRVFSDAGGSRILGLIQPIYNEPACYEASCHVHPPDRQLLGVFDIQVSLGQMDRIITDSENFIAIFTIGFILVIPSITGIFVFFFVHRPVNRLLLATRQIAAGDLSVKVKGEARDELGQLASSFNDMTGKLQHAHRQLQEWSGTLENRVREKSQQLQQVQDQIIQTEKMASLGRLAAVVAHEINNPIAGILTYTKLLRKLMQKDELPAEKLPEIRNYLSMMESETSRCGRIVRELLAYARGGGLRRERLDFQALIRSTLDLLSYKIRQQQVETVADLAPDIPPVTGNPDQLQQVIMCLINNACDVMKDGGTLTIRLWTSADPVQVCFSIRDTGPGIPAEIQSTLFEPFVSTKSSKENLGLGLFVTFGIVQQHGGTIRFTTSGNTGTEFVVALPAEPPASGPAGGVSTGSGTSANNKESA